MSPSARQSNVFTVLVRRLSYGGVLGACMLGLACDDPARAVPPAPTEPTVNTAALAGHYGLTMELSPACSALPELSQTRKYEVTLEAAGPYPYLGMYISGGGYTSPTLVGDLWPSADGRSARLTWNNFEFGCDGTPEPLPNGRALMVCGEGGSALNDRTVVADMSAQVLIDADGQRQQVCVGLHRFTFTKIRP